MTGPTAPQEPTTAGDRGTERHNFLLRVGAEAVERRGIDGRHLRTRKERNEECEAQVPQKSSDYFLMKSRPNASLRTCCSAVDRLESKPCGGIAG